jgi:zinc transporter 1/2/3
VKEYISKNNKFSVRMSVALGAGEHAHSHGASKKCNLSAVILMVALSAHSIFEGIATGLTKTTDSLANLLIAIFLHKWAAAMSLGIALGKNF